MVHVLWAYKCTMYIWKYILCRSLNLSKQLTMASMSRATNRWTGEKAKKSLGFSELPHHELQDYDWLEIVHPVMQPLLIQPFQDLKPPYQSAWSIRNFTIQKIQSQTFRKISWYGVPTAHVLHHPATAWSLPGLLLYPRALKVPSAQPSPGFSSRKYNIPGQLWSTF